MTKCLTISKLAYEIFSKDYLRVDKSIPHINKRAIYRDIKLGYYGGNTEVYKPFGENLYYYDVNSLYPYMSYNDMVGLECHKQEYINKEADLNELFTQLNLFLICNHSFTRVMCEIDTLDIIYIIFRGNI